MMTKEKDTVKPTPTGEEGEIVPDWSKEKGSDALQDSEILKRIREGDAELAHDNPRDDD